MELSIRKAERYDSELVFRCLQILLDKKMYSWEEFNEYYAKLLTTATAPDIWIATHADETVALITANKFHLPRFLGYGYEFEEIVVLPEFQSRGIGKAFILQLIDFYKQDTFCRKIIIKSNDLEGSCRLYQKIIDTTDFRVFQKYLNKI